MPSIVAQALLEKLMQWNQLVQAREIPVEPSPALDLGGMGWLKIMWTWILPPARGYRVTGMLLQNPAGAYQLSVQRTVLAHNRVDLSKTLEKRGASPDDAFRAMASEIAKWLVSPADMAASEAVARGMQRDSATWLKPRWCLPPARFSTRLWSCYCRCASRSTRVRLTSTLPASSWRMANNC